MAQYDPWENPGTYDDATWKKLKSLALLESAIEFFFVAKSALQVRRLATGSIAPFESEKAITFNFLHSIELGLKAYILRSGETSFDNLKQFRHDLSLLLEEHRNRSRGQSEKGTVTFSRPLILGGRGSET